MIIITCHPYSKFTFQRINSVRLSYLYEIFIMYIHILKSYNYTDFVHISICGLILGIAIHPKNINTASFYKLLIINFDKFYVSLINHKSNLPGLYYNPTLNFNIKFENNIVLSISSILHKS